MPIVGNGDIASVLPDRMGITFLAAGLSNSSKVTYLDFKREQTMISMYRAGHIVYFSSLCIYDSNSAYAQYKKDIEEYIKETCECYTIVRLGNISWGKNPNTIINYFKNNPNAKVEDGYRYIVDKEEFLYWIGRIRYMTKDIMNITGKLTSIKEIYERSVHGKW